MEATACAPTVFRGAGEYTYVVPLAGRYTIIVGAAGAGGSHLNMQPHDTPQRFWGGGAGAICRAVRVLEPGMRIPVTIGRPGRPEIFHPGLAAAEITVVHGVSGTGNLPWAGGGRGSGRLQNDWDENNGWADEIMDGPAGQQLSGAPGVTMIGQSITPEGNAAPIRLTSGYGGHQAQGGGEGAVLFAYLGPS
ncbi:MAG: hypothetical protein J2P48_08260 [Alphaproteobacteria bacterium]|nr:hypothetical protein [Alphaproteobacteria bacterium]